MAHMNFAGRTYSMGQEALDEAQKAVVEAVREDKAKIFFTEGSTPDGQRAESMFVYTPGVPVSFHSWDV